MPVTIIEDKVYTTPDGSRFNTEVEAIQHQKDIASKELDKIFTGIFYFRNLNSLLVERAPRIIKALSHADVRCETINSIMG